MHKGQAYCDTCGDSFYATSESCIDNLTLCTGCRGQYTGDEDAAIVASLAREDAYWRSVGGWDYGEEGL